MFWLVEVCAPWRALLCLAVLSTGSIAVGEEPQAALGTIEGILIDGCTGAPVTGVAVVAAGQGQSPTVKTDAEGRFRFQQLENRLYLVAIGPNSGYLARQEMVDLRAGARRAPLEIRAYRGGVISGRVRDVRRRPVAGVTVSLIRSGPTNGPIPPAGGGSSVTNDLGEYRITEVSHGSYRVLAERHSIRIRPLTPKEDDEERPVEGDVLTYYPNSPWAEGAGVVTAGLGQVMEGIDISLAREKTVCAQTRVMDREGTSAHPIDVRVHAQPREGVKVVARGAIPRGASFEVCGLGPGDYLLTAWPGGDKAEGRFAFLDFHTSSRRVRLPDIELQPVARVPGQVKIDGEGVKPPLPEPLRIDALSAMGPGCTNERRRVRVDREGPFELALCPNQYWLDVRPPAGFYLKSATLGGVDFSRRSIQPAGGALEIVLGRGGPTLSVQVVDEKERPVPGAVVLLGRDPMPVPFGRDDLRFAPTNSSGQAVLQGIAPGSYLVLAHVMPWDQTALSHPAFLLKHGADGERVKLSEGESRTLQLKVHDYELPGVK